MSKKEKRTQEKKKKSAEKDKREWFEKRAGKEKGKQIQLPIEADSKSLSEEWMREEIEKLREKFKETEESSELKEGRFKEEIKGFMEKFRGRGGRIVINEEELEKEVESLRKELMDRAEKIKESEKRLKNISQDKKSTLDSRKVLNNTLKTSRKNFVLAEKKLEALKDFREKVFPEKNLEKKLDLERPEKELKKKK